MRPPLRSKQETVIHSSLETVWSFNMDLTNIPKFHPRVAKVDLISGKAFREPGVSYECHISGGRHRCVEKDVEIVPFERIVTALSDDTFGITRILTDYVVESTLQRVGNSSTRIEISHYYSTPTIRAKLLHLIAKRKIARHTCATLKAMKTAIEERTRQDVADDSH